MTPTDKHHELANEIRKQGDRHFMGATWYGWDEFAAASLIAESESAATRELIAALEMAEHDRRTNHWRAETSQAISKALEAAR